VSLTWTPGEYYGAWASCTSCTSGPGCQGPSVQSPIAVRWVTRVVTASESAGRFCLRTQGADCRRERAVCCRHGRPAASRSARTGRSHEFRGVFCQAQTGSGGGKAKGATGRHVRLPFARAQRLGLFVCVVKSALPRYYARVHASMELRWVRTCLVARIWREIMGLFFCGIEVMGWLVAWKTSVMVRMVLKTLTCQVLEKLLKQMFSLSHPRHVQKWERDVSIERLVIVRTRVERI
jgi:hypothetical protein